MNHPLYAVVTGDIRNSTRLRANDLVRLPLVMKDIFQKLNLLLEKKDLWLKYSIFRGDSFQLVTQPVAALETALFVRAGLRSAYPTTVAAAVDCRLAIAIGPIENLSENITESTGQAFTLSGRMLDSMRKSHFMAADTPFPAMTHELNTELALCDALFRRWTHAQSLLVPRLLNAETQSGIAEATGISQAAVARKMQVMGWQAIEQFLLRYRVLCE